MRFVCVMEVIQKRKPHGKIVLTPQGGSSSVLRTYCVNYSVELLLDFSDAYRVTVLKGANTRICDGKSVIYTRKAVPSSRGVVVGIYSGLIGGMIAQNSVRVPTAVARGIMLHGMAAQLLARAKGKSWSKPHIARPSPKVLRI